jgi:hypothetical protein
MRVAYTEPSTTLGIIGDPHAIDDSHYVGHIINDAACIQQNTPLAVAAYNKSIKRTSACFSEKINCILATKFIKAGSEILIHYGSRYWQARLLDEANDPAFKESVAVL